MIRTIIINLKNALCLLPLTFLLLGACGGTDLHREKPFTLNLEFDQHNQVLVEGDSAGISIPLSIARGDNYLNAVTLSAIGISTDDSVNLTTRFSNSVLTPDINQSTLNLILSIGSQPTKTGQRRILLTASDGQNTEQSLLEINIVPVDAPDVYLLIGQSNMVGFGGDGDKLASAGGPDEPNSRIKQLNVTQNSETEIFNTANSYTQTSRIAVRPFLVQAEDPLHIPQNPETLAKSEDYIGLGLSFAKAALAGTERDIVLVPAAWSASAFCVSSPLQANWNAQASTNPNLGNTLLFDRAVARTNLALRESGGILRGILWHQGENDSDSAFPVCADLYQENLLRLVRALRSEIQPDARGSSARGANADIPFIVGTMSRGSDANSDFTELFAEKQIVDNVHRSVPSLLPYAAVALFDDLIPANGYPCGNDSCIHFGSLALREMGARYHQALLRAAGNTAQ